MKSPSAKKPVSRVAYLDNLRIYLTVLVILHHASIAFGGGGDWAVSDPSSDLLTDVILTFFTAVNQSYFMSAFFLMAGYFTPRSLEKKGAGSFLLDRLIRLGVPLLVYTTLIININQYLVRTVWRNQPFHWFWGYEPGHLWFLQALLLFALVYVVYRLFTGGVRSVPSTTVYPDRFPPNLALILSIVVLSLLTFTARLNFPVGEWFGGFQLAHFAHYIFCFFVGIWAYRADWFGKLTKNQAKPWGIVALVMLPLFFVIAIAGGALEGEAQLVKFMGGVTWQSFVYSIWESIMLIAMLTFLLYYFREHINRAGSLAVMLAATVYTAYIVHQTIVIGVDIVFIQMNMPLFLKFVFVSIVSVPFTFGLAFLIRMIPGAKRVLG